VHDDARLRAAITGASGLLGRRLQTALGDGAVPVPRAALSGPNLVRDPAPGDAAPVCDAPLLPGDAALADLLAGVDVVFHLAALTVVGEAQADPAAAYEANVALTWRVLQAARAAGAPRVVVASSDTVYGPDAPAPTTEDAPLRPEGAYAASKAAADILARAWPAPPDVVVVRFSNIYGPGDANTSRLVPSVVADVLAGRPPAIRGDGSAERDLLYVDDAVAALLAAARHGRAGEAYNAGTGEPTSVRALADLAVGLAGGAATPDVAGGALPAEGGRRAVDASRLHGVAGWEPLVSLRDGLARTIAAERAGVPR
jgi:nucleoside-diphosphate-sugar epimerase